MAFKIAHQRFILRLLYSSKLTAGAVSSLTEGVNTPLALQGRAAFGHPLTPASRRNLNKYTHGVWTRHLQFAHARGKKPLPSDSPLSIIYKKQMFANLRI